MNVRHEDLETRLASAMRDAARGGDEPAPNWAGVQRLAHRNRVRRVSTLAACSVLVAVLATAFTLRLGNGPARVPEAAAPPADATVTRPVLEACQALSATEFDVAAMPNSEVFADAKRGSATTVARAGRLPDVAIAGDGLVALRPANASVQGREALLQSLAAGRNWLRYERADGSVGEIVARGLADDELVTLATRLETGTGPIPRNLVSLGPVGPIHVAQSACAQRSTDPFMVTAMSGDVAGRLAYALDVLTVSSVRDEGRSTIVTNGASSGPPAVRQASEAEWRDLVAAGGTGTITSPTTAPR